MTDLFAELAADHGLVDRPGVSGDGLAERYLYAPDMVHRYAFGRWWGEPDPDTSDVWVMLNPSTGDTDQRRRQTLGRCLDWSRAAGRSGLIIVNLFAYRHTKPRELPKVADPVGPCNDDVLRRVTAAGARTVAAWGRDGGLLRRSAHVGPLLDSPTCLGTTSKGEPRHPSRVSTAVAFVPWVPSRP